MTYNDATSRRSTVLIDTPGFNSTDGLGNDVVVLGKVRDYLVQAYVADLTLGAHRAHCQYLSHGIKV